MNHTIIELEHLETQLIIFGVFLIELCINRFYGTSCVMHTDLLKSL